MEGNQVLEGMGMDVPANVTVPEVGAEMPVISKERWEQLRRMQADGQSVSQMARGSGLDRKTVRSCLRKAQWSGYQRSPLAETLLSAHQGWLKERAPELNYSARILYQELLKRQGSRPLPVLRASDELPQLVSVLSGRPAAVAQVAEPAYAWQIPLVAPLWAAIFLRSNGHCRVSDRATNDHLRVLLDHLVGDCEESRRNAQTERLGGLPVNDQFDSCDLLDR